MMPPTDPLTEC